MNRETIFLANQGDKGETTFCFDELLPSLPLPELRDTMERYYASLVPFGTPEELAQSRKIIEEFQNGIGAKLQAVLKERATSTKNWLGTWWEDYGYHMLRLPLLPYQVMCIPSQLKLVDIPTTPEYMLRVRKANRFIILIVLSNTIFILVSCKTNILLPGVLGFNTQRNVEASLVQWRKNQVLVSAI